MTEETEASRAYSMRLYPGARIRLNSAWIVGGLHLSIGAHGYIRGWGRDNRPQVEFDAAPGQLVSVDERYLAAR